MFDVTLFVGIEVCEDLETDLRRANPNAVALFINNTSEYLHEYSKEGRRYLGKFITAPASVDTFDLIATNAESLLQKLIPTFSKTQHPVQIVAAMQEPDTSNTFS